MRHADDITARRQSGRRSAIRVVHRNALRRPTINLELFAAAPALCSSFRAGVMGAAESKPMYQADDRLRGELFTSPVHGHPPKMIRWEL